MALHSRLICGNQEWVLSIIGPSEEIEKTQLNALYKNLHVSPACCTIDFSRATIPFQQALQLIMWLQPYVSDVQIAGCNSQLLTQLQQKMAVDTQIRFL